MEKSCVNNMCSTEKSQYAGLEQHEGEQIMTAFLSLGELLCCCTRQAKNQHGQTKLSWKKTIMK